MDNNIIQILMAFIGCFGFSFVFRISKNLDFSFMGSLVGAIGWSIYLSTSYLNNTFFQSFIAMLCVSIMSEALARIMKAPATIFIMIGFFPLVPGSGIYYTMLYAVQGQSDLFMQSFLNTIGISLSLALAILLSSTLFHIYKRVKNKDYASIE